jgi:hypothetical protein
VLGLSVLHISGREIEDNFSLVSEPLAKVIPFVVRYLSSNSTHIVGTVTWLTLCPVKAGLASLITNGNSARYSCKSPFAKVSKGEKDFCKRLIRKFFKIIDTSFIERQDSMSCGRIAEHSREKGAGEVLRVDGSQLLIE